MIKLLHTADVQLDAPFAFLGDKGEAHRQQLYDTFKKIVELARNEKYDILLIAGDLFNDNRPSRTTVNLVAQALSNLTIPVCILPGNHDCYDSSSIYRKVSFPPNVRILSESPTFLDFPELDLMVAGNALLSRHTQISILKGIVRRDERRWFIVMAHGNIQIPGFVKTDERPIHLHEIEACGADYVALGDWHRFADYSRGVVKAFYSGAPEPTALDQTGAGRVACVTLSEKGVDVQPIRIGTLEADSLTVDVTGLSEQDILAQINTRGNPTLMLDVTLSGLVAVGQVLDIDQFQQAAADDFYWLRISNQSHVALANIDLSEFPDSQVIGQYVRMLRDKANTTHDEQDKRITEQALQLGIALLRGEAVLK